MDCYYGKEALEKETNQILGQCLNGQILWRESWACSRCLCRSLGEVLGKEVCYICIDINYIRIFLELGVGVKM